MASKVIGSKLAQHAANKGFAVYQDIITKKFVMVFNSKGRKAKSEWNEFFISHTILKNIVKKPCGCCFKCIIEVKPITPLW